MAEQAARSGGLIADLVKLRDELRLHSHLGGLEAKAAWRRLEPWLTELERELDRRGAQALDVAGLLALELARALIQQVPDRALGQMPVQEAMQRRVATCSPDEPLLAAADRMFEEQCGALVVLGRRQQPIAMLTDRDLAMAVRSREVPLAELRVSNAMSRSVHCCTPVCTLIDALAVMRTARVRRLPVIDGERRVIGIVSLDDLACYVEARVPAGIPSALQAELARSLAAIATPSVVRRRVANPETPGATRNHGS